MTKDERLAEARDYAGARSAHFSQSTGTLVVVLCAREAGLDFSEGQRWYTLCDDHGHLVSHQTLELAKYFAPHPENWCEPCSNPDEWFFDDDGIPVPVQGF